MTQPLNYVVKAIEGLEALAPDMASASRAGARYLIGKLREAQVFVMPEYGALLDRHKPRPEVPGLTFQPPFPVVALEYAAPADMGSVTPGYTEAPASKRIALAWRWSNDLPREIVESGYAPQITTDGVVVASISYMDGPGLWIPMPSAAFIEFDGEWTAPDRMPHAVAAMAAGRISRAQFEANSYTFRPVPILPEAMEGMVRMLGCDGTHDHLSADLMDELNAYLDLCYALSCRNVGFDRVSASPKLNKARVQRGDLPLKDFHVLNLTGSDGGGFEGNVGGVTKRAHLRRGHIRQLRYLGEGRMTWVNATMVKGRGFVDKVYSV